MMDFVRRLIGLPTKQRTLEDIRMGESEKTLVVGLGNPGRKHQGNRHNVGFMVVDALASAHGITFGRSQKKAAIGTGDVAGRSVIIVKPQTYMNRSGDAVGPLANFYKIPPDCVLVTYDDLDLPLGTLRLREGGGSGGHNGMRSIIYHLGNDFPRVRIGIGRPAGRMDPADFVLQNFSEGERTIVSDVLGVAVSAIETFLHDGIEEAMTRYNGTVVADHE
jgi:PTH1 family peptidyl-tRNA hydrolase